MRVVYCYFKIVFCILIVSTIFTNSIYGQSYGLGFYSHGVVQDKRTSLDLTPEKPLCFNDNFDISFDISFYPNRSIYFGYIIRIIDDNGRNIDLVYDAQSSKNHFNLIVGDKLTKILFDIPPYQLFNQWNKLTLKFDFTGDRLIFYSGGRMFTQSGLHLKKGACYKIIFGVNDYNQFQTTDVPPMKIRNVRISQNGILKYNWPLNEEDGQVAHETVAQNNGAVQNPLWITAMHHYWQPVRATIVDGVASVAFNANKGIVYVVGSDSLFSYNVNNGNWSSNAYAEGKLILNQGNQSFYDPYDDGLYNVYVDKNFVARYNFTTRSWDKKFETGPVTNFWHINKLVSAIDTSLYLFDGYGHLVYKNTVQQYHFNSRVWKTIKTNGDFFMPRYLAALGATAKGDTAYILGGYGNASGQQILNPKNIYDLMRFTVKDHKFKNLFSLKVNDGDFAFANSLVIDGRSKTYYGLVFPQHKYNSTLQLIKGSLTKPDYTLMGGSIPYSFHDIHSFADLYYSPASKQFVAVTLLRMDNNQTQVRIYTLLTPPYGTGNEIAETTGKKTYWFIIAFVLGITGLAYAWYKRKAGAKKAHAVNTVLTAVQHEPVMPERHNGTATFKNTTYLKDSILLFGDLQVFDAEGSDITKHFTPLIKELFLVILLYSIRWGRGLSSEKLNEILWYDKSAKSARNNRSVNIAKLKNLLDKMGYCNLSKETGYWKIDIDFDHIYVDYQDYLNIINDKKELDAEKIKCLSHITQRGNFLSNIEYEWLDPFKSEISNEVIDTYLHFAHSGASSHDPELMVELAGFIFYFDPVNEEAMILKCKALSALGKHSLAKSTFENFVKEYRIIYGEEFKKDFHAILE